MNKVKIFAVFIFILFLPILSKAQDNFFNEKELNDALDKKVNVKWTSYKNKDDALKEAGKKLIYKIGVVVKAKWKIKLQVEKIEYGNKDKITLMYTFRVYSSNSDVSIKEKYLKVKLVNESTICLDGSYYEGEKEFIKNNCNTGDNISNLYKYSTSVYYISKCGFFYNRVLEKINFYKKQLGIVDDNTKEDQRKKIRIRDIVKPKLFNLIKEGKFDDLVKYSIVFVKLENAKDDKGKTPLMYAVEKGNSDMVMYLVEHKAKVNIKDKQGKTPLMYAVINKNFKIVKYLVKKNAYVNDKDKNGKTALMYAVEKGNFSIVKYLVRHKAKINIKDKQGKTPLMYAVIKKYPEIVEYLVEKDADVNERDNYHKTALIYAVKEINEDLLDALKVRDFNDNSYLLKNLKNKMSFLKAIKEIRDIYIDGDMKSIIKILLGVKNKDSSQINDNDKEVERNSNKSPKLADETSIKEAIKEAIKYDNVNLLKLLLLSKNARVENRFIEEVLKHCNFDTLLVLLSHYNGDVYMVVNGENKCCPCYVICQKIVDLYNKNRKKKK